MDNNSELNNNVTPNNVPDQTQTGSIPTVADPTQTASLPTVEDPTAVSASAPEEAPALEPTVKVEEITLDDNSKALRVTMSYKNKIASCQLNFNGQDYDVTIDQDQTNPLTFSLPLQNGANTIKLKVIGTDNTVTEFENTYSN